MPITWKDFGIGVANDLVGGLIDSGFGALQGYQNYRYNEKAADNADQRQRQQFKDMYSIGAQMQQLKDAGLSPSMFFGGVPSQGGATAPQGAGAGGPMINTSPIDLLTSAQIENIKADTKKKESEAENLDEDTNLKGQQIINLVADTNNKKIENRLISAQADLAELELDINTQTAQSTISMAYSNSARAAAEARSAVVQADLDEALFICSYEMAYAELDNTITDTALKKAGISLTKAQIKEISERIRKSTWETWAMEKEQNRKDALFYLDQAKLKAECAKWAAEINVRLTEAELNMVSDLLGYIVNFATCGLTNITDLQKSEQYNKTRKEIATQQKTTNTSTDHFDKYGNRTGHSYTTTSSVNH